MTSPSVILIIDDDALLGRSLVRLAERTFPGYHCVWARDGIAGGQLARQHAEQLGLVLLDIAKPRMDGNLVAVQIRTLAPHVPILPFSADFYSGEYGEVEPEEGESRATVRKRLKEAAERRDVSLTFLRTAGAALRFQVVRNGDEDEEEGLRSLSPYERESGLPFEVREDIPF